MKPTQHNTTQSELDVRTVQTQIADAILLVGVAVGVIGILFDYRTMQETGWQHATWGLFTVIAIVALTAIFRKRIPYNVKTAILIGAVYVTAVSELVGWGLIGGSSIWFILTVLLTMILHNMRIGMMVYGLVVVTVATIAMLFRMDVVNLTLDYNIYATSQNAWLSRMLMIVFVSAMVVVSFGRIITVLKKQLAHIKQTARELEIRTDDLTQEIQKRKQAESALADAVVQLQDLDKLKDKFIDSASHELRTPIANIQLYLQLIGMKPEKVSQYLDTLNEETARLTHVVDQMVHASSDNYELELTTMVEIDVLNMTERLFNTYTEQLSEANISLKVIDAPKPLTTLVASEHMERMLINVVDNAVKYTPENGHITIRGEHIPTTEDDHYGHIHLFISNSSVPFPPEDYNRVFDRFYRGETSLTLGVPGAGLGLSITQHIIEKYDGSISLTSSQDDNTVTARLEFVAVRPFEEILADEQPISLSSA